MDKNKLSFRQAAENKDIFSVTWELVPGRGAWEKSQNIYFSRRRGILKGY
jgi:hypothetical protein